jgi:TonB family protein
MKKLPSRVLFVVCASLGATQMWGVNADPQPLARGQGESHYKAATKAKEIMLQDPREDLHRRLGGRAKDIKIKMLRDKPGEDNLQPEYDWATKAKPKGTAPQVVYPFDELAHNESGTATIRFRINYEGKVDLSMILEATKPAFGRAAQAAIETMTFTPAKKKDKSPAMVLCDADFRFLPDGSGDVLVTEEIKDLLNTARRGEEAAVAIGGLDVPLRAVSSMSPNYPTSFAKVGTVGSATIEFIVNDTGWVALPRVVSASEAEFGAAAVQAVSTWRFEPPTKNGRIANALARIVIEFNPGAAAPPVAP